MDNSSEVVPGVDASRVTQNQPNKKSHSKRKRQSSGEWSKHGKGKHHGYQTPQKKQKTAVSSKRAANTIMKFRLGGSVSDPLNLEGADNLGAENPPSSDEVQAPPPLLPPLLPPQLQKDPLNLEGKVKNFPLPGVGVGGTSQRRRLRRRTTSGSKAGDGGVSEPKQTPTPGHPKPSNQKKVFPYGNYNRYYSYRNSGVQETDPRLVLLQKEWFKGQDCLDIGCNTGQVTIGVAKEMEPRKIVGLDIDHKLVTTAWKNLHRSYIPSLTPDGQPFPASLTMSRGSAHFPPVASVGSSSDQSSLTLEEGQSRRGQSFPHNVHFCHGNYVPKADEASSLESQVPEYDVILALSLTKWVHLNWGDGGIKRLFKKVYRHLRPGGRLILEPQPYSSYSKRKNLTVDTLRNYQNISFLPEDFENYLLSEEVGFDRHVFLGTPQSKHKGFRRPLHMYIKRCEDEATPHEDTVGNHGAKERLKSVVVPLKS